jgi:hypothetical protein
VDPKAMLYRSQEDSEVKPLKNSRLNRDRILSEEETIQTVKMVLLELIPFYSSKRMFLPLTKDRIYVETDSLSRDLVVELSTYIYGQESAPPEVIQYPANWLEAVKDRWAPMWLLNLFPVKHTVHKIEHKLLYPDLIVPDLGPWVPFVTKLAKFKP